MIRIALLCLLACTVADSSADTYEAPLDVRKTVDASITFGPVVATANGQPRITFEISEATDVEVAILGANGTVVRHLAAGLLGEHAPEPFQKGSLRQTLPWDGRDDAGRPAEGGPFHVRVRAGSQPKLDAYLGRDENQLSGEICAVTASPKGGLYVLLADPYRGRSEIRVLDRDGAYLRTIVPYPSANRRSLRGWNSRRRKDALRNSSRSTPRPHPPDSGCHSTVDGDNRMSSFPTRTPARHWRKEWPSEAQKDFTTPASWRRTRRETAPLSTNT